jgi:hypothetical protein
MKHFVLLILLIHGQNFQLSAFSNSNEKNFQAKDNSANTIQKLFPKESITHLNNCPTKFSTLNILAIEPMFENEEEDFHNYNEKSTSNFFDLLVSKFGFSIYSLPILTKRNPEFYSCIKKYLFIKVFRI